MPLGLLQRRKRPSKVSTGRNGPLQAAEEEQDLAAAAPSTPALSRERTARLRSLLSHHSGRQRLRQFRSWQRRQHRTMDYFEYRACLQMAVSESDAASPVGHAATSSDVPDQDKEALSDSKLLGQVRAAARPKPREEQCRVQPLSPEEQSIYDRCVCQDGSPDEVLVSRFNISITRDVLQCLRPHGWLNDEVINFYCKLLQERCAKVLGGPNKCWFTNSFFWNKLSGGPEKRNNAYSYPEVRRWTTRAGIDVFGLDCVIFPMNVGEMHWALGVIDFREKGFRYFDSMCARPHRNFAPFLRRYLNDEHTSKKAGPLAGVEAWELLPEDPCVPPRQRNSYDCGVFMCCFADHFCQGKPFHFDQDNMPDLRARLAVRVIQGQEDWDNTNAA